MAKANFSTFVSNLDFKKSNKNHKENSLLAFEFNVGNHQLGTRFYVENNRQHSNEVRLDLLKNPWTRAKAFNFRSDLSFNA